MQSSKAQEELLAQLEKFRRTIIVMFTDIKGSTAYFEKYGDVAGLMMVHQCNDMLRQIVESHGGHIECASNVPRGTCIEITFPTAASTGRLVHGSRTHRRR